MMENTGKKRRRRKERVSGRITAAGAAAVLLCAVLLWEPAGEELGAAESREEETELSDESALRQEDAGVGQQEANASGGQAEEPMETDASGETEGIGVSEETARTSAHAGQSGKAVDSGVSGETIDTDASSESAGCDILLSFAGDICFDDTCAVMQNYIGQGEKLENNIDPELLRLMRESDLCWINNEFAYSDRGEPLENKMYTFRAAPERAAMLREMGVDIAGLANNHVYDFGAEAMEDTFEALRLADIDYVGAGRNLAEAMTPVYREVDGITIAYVAASRAEKYKMTPQATEAAAGILRCYDTELFVREIEQARENADYVAALVHWGTEYSTELEEVQKTTGREYIDAGADIVIGAHTHCLQGMEYYRGKPIIYSLGNFWFNDKPLDTMLLQVRLSGVDYSSEITADNVEVQIVPAKQENCETRLLKGDEAEKLFEYLEKLSEGLVIDEEGVVQEISN